MRISDLITSMKQMKKFAGDCEVTVLYPDGSVQFPVEVRYVELITHPDEKTSDGDSIININHVVQIV